MLLSLLNQADDVLCRTMPILRKGAKVQDAVFVSTIWAFGSLYSVTTMTHYRQGRAKEWWDDVPLPEKVLLWKDAEYPMDLFDDMELVTELYWSLGAE